jgi:hypothetical protein
MEDMPVRVRPTVSCEPRGESLTVALAGGTPITIRSEVAGVLPWLEEVLAPAFSVIEDGGAAMRVLISSERAQDDSCAPGSSFPCFALDTEVRRLPGRSVGSSFVLDDERWGTRYEVGPDLVRISASGPHARIRVAALRVVREMATVHALADVGRVQLHASCLAWEGRCVVLAGPKRAGKTTLLARLAASTGAAIVANDRVILHPSETGWQVTGVPTIASVRPGTMRLLPDLFRTVPAVPRPIDLTIPEAAAAAARFGTVTEPTALSLSPAQLAREVGSTLCAGRPLACLAVIGIDSDFGDFHVERLSQRDAADAIKRVRYGANARADAPTVFERVFAGDHRGSATEPPAPDLAASPWVQIGITERFLTSPDAPRALMRTLCEQ